MITFKRAVSVVIVVMFVFTLCPVPSALALRPEGGQGAGAQAAGAELTLAGAAGVDLQEATRVVNELMSQTFPQLQVDVNTEPQRVTSSEDAIVFSATIRKPGTRGREHYIDISIVRRVKGPGVFTHTIEASVHRSDSGFRISSVSTAHIEQAGKVVSRLQSELSNKSFLNAVETEFSVTAKAGAAGIDLSEEMRVVGEFTNQSRQNGLNVSFSVSTQPRPAEFYGGEIIFSAMFKVAGANITSRARRDYIEVNIVRHVGGLSDVTYSIGTSIHFGGLVQQLSSVTTRHGDKFEQNQVLSRFKDILSSDSFSDILKVFSNVAWAGAAGVSAQMQVLVIGDARELQDILTSRAQEHSVDIHIDALPEATPEQISFYDIVIKKIDTGYQLIKEAGAVSITCNSLPELQTAIDKEMGSWV